MSWGKPKGWGSGWSKPKPKASSTRTHQSTSTYGVPSSAVRKDYSQGRDVMGIYVPYPNSTINTRPSKNWDPTHTSTYGVPQTRSSGGGSGGGGGGSGGGGGGSGGGGGGGGGGHYSPPPLPTYKALTYKDQAAITNAGAKPTAAQLAPLKVVQPTNKPHVAVAVKAATGTAHTVRDLTPNAGGRPTAPAVPADLALNDPRRSALQDPGATRLGPVANYSPGRGFGR